MNEKPVVSIVIPARNEEAHLPRCLQAIARARDKSGAEVETIVVLNRCTDRTEAIAAEHGCRIVRDESKNLSRIRNAGARLATGEVIVTVDADSTMSEKMLSDILAKLSRQNIVGGGVLVLPERWSAGIFFSGVFLLFLSLRYGGISAGLFFCKRADFEAISGFDEDLVTAEDIDFARRLKQHGAATGRRFTTIFSSWIVTSCRKFDHFGDWYFLMHPSLILKALRGKSADVANHWWYDFKR